MSLSDDFTFVGSDGQQTLNLNIDRHPTDGGYTGNLDISLGDGNDSVLSAKMANGDSLDAGGGDDTIYINIDGHNGTPAFGSLDMVKLDGGAGIDTLSFEESDVRDYVSGGGELTLALGGAVNFENLSGTEWAETIRGDSNDNVLSGNGEADIIYGGAGDDTLYAHSYDDIDSGASYASTNDTLNGEAGNDT